MRIGIPQAKRIGADNRIVADVGIEIVATLSRVFAQELTRVWIVVSGAIVVQASR